jgi:hypothetical protein
MGQDVANVRLAPEGGNDGECEIGDGDLPIIMGHPAGGLGSISPVLGEPDRVAVDLSRDSEFLEHHGTL